MFYLGRGLRGGSNMGDTPTKKGYTKPELIKYGSLEELTQIHVGDDQPHQSSPVGDPRSHNPAAKPAMKPDAIYDTGSS